MRPADYIRTRPLATAACVGLLLGTLVGALWPLPERATKLADEQAFAAPSRAQIARYSEPLYLVVRDGHLWAGSGVGQASGGKLANWRLLGVLTRPVPQAVVQPSEPRNSKPVRVQVGGALPDGTVLAGVTGNAVEFDRKGCRYIRALYSEEDVAAPGNKQGCASGTKNGRAKQQRTPAARNG